MYKDFDLSRFGHQKEPQKLIKGRYSAAGHGDGVGVKNLYFISGLLFKLYISGMFGFEVDKKLVENRIFSILVNTLFGLVCNMKMYEPETRRAETLNVPSVVISRNHRITKIFRPIRSDLEKPRLTTSRREDYSSHSKPWTNQG